MKDKLGGRFDKCKLKSERWCVASRIRHSDDNNSVCYSPKSPDRLMEFTIEIRILYIKTRLYSRDIPSHAIHGISWRSEQRFGSEERGDSWKKFVSQEICKLVNTIL